MIVRFACLVFGIALSAIAAAGALAQERPKVEVVSQIGHSNIVQSVAYSPDGTRVLSGGLDNTIKLWDVSSGRLLRTFGGHADSVNAVAFSPDGSKILSGSSDKKLKLWDAVTGQMLRTFEGHSDVVNAVGFSSDGSKILSGSSDKTVKLWDAGSGQVLRSFAGHTESVESVALSADRTKVLSGSADKTLRLWDADSGRLLRTLKGHSETVNSVAFSPDGSRLVSGSGDKTLKVWDAAKGERLRTLEGHTNDVSSVAFSPDGRQIFSGSRDGTLKLWDVATGKILRAFDGGASSVAFSPDGSKVISSDGGNMLALWDVATGKMLREFGSKLSTVREAVFSADDAKILSASDDDILKLWDATTGRLAHSIKASKDVVWAAISPDGRTIVSASAGSEDPPKPGKLEWWDAITGKLLRDFAGDLGGITMVKFSPDGSKLLTGDAYDSDTALQLWDAATGKLLRSFTADGSAMSAAFSTDGSKVVAGGGFSVRLWDAATGKLLRSFKASGEVNAVAMSPDGKTLVSASDKTLQLWDAATGKVLRAWDLGRLTSVVFSPDGRKLVAGGWDNTVKELDLTTGKLSRTLAGHSGKVNSVNFSHDGRSIVSGSDDGTVRLWSASAGSDAAIVLAMFEGARLVLTPSGFFDFDGDIRKYVHLVRGFEVMTLGQVQQSLYSPDLVREALTGDVTSEVKRATEVVNLEKVVDSGPAPDVEIISPAAGTASADLVTVTARIRDRGKGIGRIEWRVNGVTAGVCPTACLGPNNEVRRQLALDPGENTVEVVAYNAGDIFASIPAQIANVHAGESDTRTPKLHVLAIGINNYVDRGGVKPGETRRMRFPELGLAVGDAKAIATELKNAGERLYSDVRVRTVFDAEATAAKLDAVVTEFAKGISPRDTFILFAAAHGYSHEGRFYLIPQDYDGGPEPEALKTRAIDQLKLQDWIANRIKAKKALILFDTCESGALTNGYLRSRVDVPASDAGVGRLHEATGRPVLTATAQGQGAAEYQEVEHALFTASLLDALRHAEANKDGVIMLSALAAHVQEMVPKLVKDLTDREELQKRGPAGGIQSVRFGSRGEDFAIVRRLQ